MAKKEVKPVASGVNLDGLSCAQLKALSVEASVKASDLAEKEGKAAVKALKASGELDALKKEWAALVKDGKKLARPAKFDIMVPVRFTMQTDEPAPAYAFDGYDEESEFFNHGFTATIIKEGCPLTKKQRDALENTVADYAANACEDIFDLLPEGLMAHYDAWTKKVVAFAKKAKEQSVSIEDLA